MGKWVLIENHRADSAPSIGPIVGGCLIQSVGWRWIFWLLVILTGSHFILIALFLPETQRRIVGNGSGPATGIYWSLFSKFQTENSREHRADASKVTHHFPNPLGCLPILLDRASLLAMLITAVNYAVKMSLQTSLGSTAVETYNLNFLAAGLIYLPSGVGGGVGSFITGW